MELASIKELVIKSFKKKTGKCYICRKRGHNAKECKTAIYNQIKKLWNNLNNLKEQVFCVPMITTNRLKNKFKNIDNEISEIKNENLNNLTKLEELNEKMYNNCSSFSEDFSISTDFFSVAGKPSEPEGKLNEIDNDILVCETEEEYKKLSKKLLKDWENAVKLNDENKIKKSKIKIEKLEIYNRDIIDPMIEYERNVNVILEFITNKKNKNKFEILTSESKLKDPQRALQKPQAHSEIVDQKFKQPNLVGMTDAELASHIKKNKYDEGLYELSTKSGELVKVDSENQNKENIKINKKNKKNKKSKEDYAKENLEQIKAASGEMLYSKVKRDYDFRLHQELVEILEKKYEIEYGVMDALIKYMQKVTKKK